MIYLSIGTMVIAVGLTIAFLIYKKWINFQRALDILTLLSNSFMVGKIDRKDYEEEKEKVYVELNKEFLYRHWLRKLKK